MQQAIEQRLVQRDAGVLMPVKHIEHHIGPAMAIVPIHIERNERQSRDEQPYEFSALRTRARGKRPIRNQSQTKQRGEIFG